MPVSPIAFAKGKDEIDLLPGMANRHGLVAGATGTGKTVTLQTLAEQFSQRGVPVFMADVKGDLAGISQAGGGNDKVAARVKQLGLSGAPEPGVSGGVLGLVGRAGASGAGDGIRDGTAAAEPVAEPERHAGGSAEHCLQGGG